MGFDSWGDAKRGIFEDLIIYGGMLGLFIAFDPVINLLHASGIVIFDHEITHPLNFGKGQIVGVLFSGLQLIRKISAWKYYS